MRIFFFHIPIYNCLYLWFIIMFLFIFFNHITMHLITGVILIVFVVMICVHAGVGYFYKIFSYVWNTDLPVSFSLLFSPQLPPPCKTVCVFFMSCYSKISFSLCRGPKKCKGVRLGGLFILKKSKYFWQNDLSTIFRVVLIKLFFVCVCIFHVIIASQSQSQSGSLGLFFEGRGVWSFFQNLWLTLPHLTSSQLRTYVLLVMLPPSLKRFLCESLSKNVADNHSIAHCLLWNCEEYFNLWGNSV